MWKYQVSVYNNRFLHCDVGIALREVMAQLNMQNLGHTITNVIE